MKRKWDTFCDDTGGLKEGQEIAITVRSLQPGRRKYESHYVKAVVSSSPRDVPDWDELWLRWQRGYLRPQPWAIRIIVELGEYMPKGIPGEGRGARQF